MMDLNDTESTLIFVTEDEAGQRLDKILAKRFSSLQSRSYFQFLIEERLVLLNGMPVKKRVKPQEGDEIEVEFVATPEIPLMPEPIPLDILFEDKDILVINKPAGMVVHPAPGNWSHTFVNALLHHCQIIENSESSLRPGIVHRLDKETSGVLVAAKTSLAHQRLVEMFASRQVEKEYLAICIGNPGSIEIDAPIGRHPVHRKLMAVIPEKGKSAVTICNPLAFDGKLSVVKIRLLTGRTHQIRVHLHYQGSPILGDKSYGNAQANKKWGVERQMLHAYTLCFKHPIHGHLLNFQAPLPQDIKKWIPKEIE